MSTIILVKATGAAESDDFIVTKGYPETISAYPSGNMGADLGKLRKKNPDGTYDPVHDNAGNLIELKPTRLHFTVVGGGTYRIEFAGRTAAIGVTKQRL